MAGAWEGLAEELVRGSEEEFVAELTRRMIALLERGCSNPDRLAAIASRAREAALGVWAEWSGRVSGETERAFAEALSAEQEAIEASLAEAFGPIDPALAARGRNEVAQAARGMASILARQNVALADGLADEWWHATSDAVTRIQLGDSLEAVVRDGVRRLAAAGLATIDYRSGVRTAIDAAVRRHAITQQNQCRNDMLVRGCREHGVRLVFTSAHYGARPSHAAWQGKPYGLDGPCEVDGIRYEGLAEATGYGTVAGLAGANCRHRLFPYVPGLTRLPDTDFRAHEAKWHMTSDEYYEAAQRQRAMEREIRRTKRQIALGEGRGLDMAEDRYRLGAQQKKLREHCARTGLPRDRSREKAYAAADPRGGAVEIIRQPRALDPGSREARACREMESLRRRNAPGGASYERTSSPIASASSFGELDAMVGGRLGGGLSWGARNLDFESVRGVACGIDDVAQRYGINGIMPGQIASWRLPPRVLAETTSSGSVRLGERLFSTLQPAAASIGRHEAGHLIEVYLSHGDAARFESGRDARRIISRAFRAYKGDHPETALDVHRAIFSISAYPAREAAWTDNPGVEYSEALAEAVERIAGQSIKEGSFLAYIDESIRKELR